jgi:hypothetical protein
VKYRILEKLKIILKSLFSIIKTIISIPFILIIIIAVYTPLWLPCVIIGLLIGYCDKNNTKAGTQTDYQCVGSGRYRDCD